jgi:hypothetical protein
MAPLVVAAAPGLDDLAGMGQGLEPLIERFVAQAPTEGPDESVPPGPPRSDVSPVASSASLYPRMASSPEAINGYTTLRDTSACIALCRNTRRRSPRHSNRAQSPQVRVVRRHSSPRWPLPRDRAVKATLSRITDPSARYRHRPCIFFGARDAVKPSIRANSDQAGTHSPQRARQVKDLERRSDSIGAESALDLSTPGPVASDLHIFVRSEVTNS